MNETRTYTVDEIRKISGDRAVKHAIKKLLWGVVLIYATVKYCKEGDLYHRNSAIAEFIDLNREQMV